ncbi:hypothetical protein BGZ51_008909 [Haplosporangium sp. Z 767]|nr:hypothetical protein BGZ51_008909 [Haplosporangium sp. Z 767]KAF9191064.1 hypothetical protein BGZ50_009677 [Haplosporangium sp. Z 11]
MICYKNTQCVPAHLFCNSTTDPCTDIDGEQDSDSPILCQDQLCVSADFLPLPSPGYGKVDRSSDCLPGSYYSLFGTTPKYTQSCIEPYFSAPTKCKPWEYLAQSSCFLSTCGPGLDCQPPYICNKLQSNDLYGICSGSSGTSGGMGDADTADGGSTGRYSSKEYLVQGLLIGICCLALGVGLGVGFWHYRKQKFNTQWTQSERDPSFTSSRTARESQPSKGSTLLSTLTCCSRRGRRRSDVPPADTFSSGENRDSFVESEGYEGSLASDRWRRSNIFFSGRWRWGNSSNQMMARTMTPGGMTLIPEIEPPPLYQNGPDLPAYGDSADGIAMSIIDPMNVATNTSSGNTASEPHMASLAPHLDHIHETLHPDMSTSAQDHAPLAEDLDTQLSSHRADSDISTSRFSDGNDPHLVRQPSFSVPLPELVYLRKTRR